MKLLRGMLAVMAVFLLLGGQGTAVAAESSGNEEISIVVASDLHYISPTLTDGGEYFTKLVDSADGKVMHYSEELVSAFLEDVIAQKPDALVLSGDLTFNGALTSHRDLAARLRAVETAGIPVLVISGNHDINNRNAARFSGSGFERVHSASAEEFTEVYREFGYDEAISRAPDTFSYLYSLGGNLRVLMLDTNSVTENAVTRETLAWVEQVLWQAAEDGARVIAVSHQNLLMHHSMFPWGYQIENHVQLGALYKKYGVLCNFSGHMHIQDRMHGYVEEILTSALSIVGSHYGVVTFTPGDWSYETKSADVSGWAERHGSTDPNLLDFAAYAREYFAACGSASLDAYLSKEELEEETYALLAGSFDELNRRFFTGEPISAEEFSPVFDFWREQPASFLQHYILSLEDRAVPG